MTAKLSDQKVKNGALIPVSNELRKKFSSASKEFLALWVDDVEVDGDEICLLFTKHVVQRAQQRANRNPEDIPQKSWFGSISNGDLVKVTNELRKKFSNADKEYYAVWITNSDGNELCLLFTDHEIEVAKYRMGRNPEDWPKKGWFTDLLD